MSINTIHKNLQLIRRAAKLSLMVALLIWTQGVHAQTPAEIIPKKALKYFNEANYSIGLNEFKIAEEKLLLAIKIYPAYTQARVYLGDIYYQNGQYDLAIDQYGWVRSAGPHPVRVELFLARCSFQQQQFDRCVEYLDEYITSSKISQQAKRDAILLRANALFSQEAMNNPVDFNPVNLGSEVNSEDNEYMPSLNADETTVIFTRLINGQEDLYLTGIKNGQWLKAEPVDEGTINTGHNEGAHCISADGNTLLYTICNERTTRGSCDLYISRKQKNGWGPPKNIGPPLSSVSWDSQPSLSADGRSIYFVSNRQGGYGGFDIYVSHHNGEGWEEPENLGPLINTPYDEQTPFIHFDDQTLYFSSDGHPGMGKQDLYFSRKTDGAWTLPTNLGYPINTAAIESGLNISLDGLKAYYAAERAEGEGGLDIYAFDLPEFARPKRVTYVRAQIVDSRTGKPIDAEFNLQNLTGPDGNVYGTAERGEFLICLPSGDDYSLHIKQDGYVFESLHFSLTDTVMRKAHILEVRIDPVDSGKSVVLRNVFFETDRYELLPESTGELEALIDFLETNPNIRLEISGHTDNTGSAEHNQTLSMKRAQAVVDYLVTNGVSASRLTARGYGPDQPIAGNDSAAGRAENRRTEFRILP